MSAEARNFWGATAIVAVAILANLPGLVDPAILHDEVVTVRLIAGNPEPTWPQEVVPAGQVLAGSLSGSTSPSRLVADLLRLDVHPPVYFLAVSGWRMVFGQSLEALRAFSVIAMIVAGLVFRSALRRAGHPTPELAGLLFVSLSGLVVVGQVARPYGLALCFLCLAGWCTAAYLDSPSWRPALGCAFFSSLAFLSSYLALFPLVAILAAFCIGSWVRGGAKGRLRALVVPGLVGLSWLPWAAFIVRQSVSRPDQEASFAGWPAQLVHLWGAHETLLFVTFHPFRPVAVAALMAIGFVAWIRIQERDRALSWLLLVWAILPAMGMVALNLAFDKHLNSPRYLVFAAAGIAGLMGYILARLPRRWAWVACGLFIALQFFAISRFESEGTPTSNLATKVMQEGTESTVVLVGSSSAFHGFPGRVLYELEASVPVLILDDDDDLAALQAHVAPFQQVWLLAPPPHVTRGLEDVAFRQLLDSSAFRVVQANEAACQLRRTNGSPVREPDAKSTGPSLQSRPPLT